MPEDLQRNNMTVKKPALQALAFFERSFAHAEIKIAKNEYEELLEYIFQLYINV